MRTRMMCVAIVTAFVSTLAGWAAADVVWTCDFDGLDGTGTGQQLDGQDGWFDWNTNGDHDIVTDEQGAWKSGTRTVAALNRTSRDISGRPWSLSIPSDGSFSIEYMTRFSNAGLSATTEDDNYTVKTEIYSGTKPVLGFGYRGTEDKWSVVGGGTTTLSDVTFQDDEPFAYYFIKLDVDLSANGGEGAATMYADQVANSSPDTETPVYSSPILFGGSSSVNLGLATAGLDDTSAWGGIRIDLSKNALVDEITVTYDAAPIPEPALLGALGFVLIATRTRRTR
jgi:hypothetical protein